MLRGCDGLEAVHLCKDSLTGVPGHVCRGVCDIVALHSADGNEGFGVDVYLFQKGAALGADIPVDLFAVVHKVHLVDKHGNLADAQNGEKIAVAAGVFLNAVGSVDNQQSGLGAGGAGDHVFEEFNVAGSVDYDITSGLGLEKAPGSIDGNTLSLFVFQSVQKKCVFKGLGVTAAVFADSFKLSVGKGAGIRQKAAYNGAFAVVNVTDCDYIQKFFHGGGSPPS